MGYLCFPIEGPGVIEAPVAVAGFRPSSPSVRFTAQNEPCLRHSCVKQSFLMTIFIFEQRSMNFRTLAQLGPASTAKAAQAIQPGRLS